MINTELRNAGLTDAAIVAIEEAPFEIQGVLKRARQDAQNVQLFSAAALSILSQRIALGVAAATVGDAINARRHMQEAAMLTAEVHRLAGDWAEVVADARDAATIGVDAVRKFQFPKDLFNLGRVRKRLDETNAAFKVLDERSFELRQRARALARAWSFPPHVIQALG